MRTWGSTMALLHCILLHHILLRLPRAPAGVRRWPWRWLDPAANHVVSRPWLRDALTSVLSQAEYVVTTRNLTLGIIHGDGAPVMVDSSTRRLSVIDWGAAMWGPLLYDVATAYWFSVIERGLGSSVFDGFMRAYLDAAPIKADESQSLDAFIRLRGIVLGFYFAWRCDNDIQTGLSPGDNELNLADIREKIERLLTDRTTRFSTAGIGH
jgi:Ser/Thr protein kinase RdoA (MazF antagonist)